MKGFCQTSDELVNGPFSTCQNPFKETDFTAGGIAAFGGAPISTTKRR